MTGHLRQGLVARTPAAKLEGTAEIDEVYIVAGHKGQPAEVEKRGGRDGVAGFRVRRDQHAGEGETASAWLDPARRAGDPAYAAQRAAGNHQADHHPGGGTGDVDPYRRIRHLCPAARLGLWPQDRLPRSWRVCAR